ncbi:uncharacterized protein LOC135922520 isoform X2 [Gordionus sp. m RMFG-2023]|uniref:uncharacterized protein LOC135922520 isoform X2 n=1 Tax=Gordionus sp. m RMFG-2023 TaxID=3053472 RepID=UPI0031FBA8BC
MSSTFSQSNNVTNQKIDKKSKFSLLNINTIYKGKGFDSQRSSKSYGIQSIGKVTSSKRLPPPAILPTNRAEIQGNDNINITTGTSWVNKDTEINEISNNPHFKNDLCKQSYDVLSNAGLKTWNVALGNSPDLSSTSIIPISNTYDSGQYSTAFQKEFPSLSSAEVKSSNSIVNVTSVNSSLHTETYQANYSNLSYERSKSFLRENANKFYMQSLVPINHLRPQTNWKDMALRKLPASNLNDEPISENQPFWTRDFEISRNPYTYLSNAPLPCNEINMPLSYQIGPAHDNLSEGPKKENKKVYGLIDGSNFIKKGTSLFNKNHHSSTPFVPPYMSVINPYNHYENKLNPNLQAPYIYPGASIAPPMLLKNRDYYPEIDRRERRYSSSFQHPPPMIQNEHFYEYASRGGPIDNEYASPDYYSKKTFFNSQTLSSSLNKANVILKKNYGGDGVNSYYPRNKLKYGSYDDEYYYNYNYQNERQNHNARNPMSQNPYSPTYYQKRSSAFFDSRPSTYYPYYNEDMVPNGNYRRIKYAEDDSFIKYHQQAPIGSGINEKALPKSPVPYKIPPLMPQHHVPSVFIKQNSYNTRVNSTLSDDDAHQNQVNQRHKVLDQEAEEANMNRPASYDSYKHYSTEERHFPLQSHYNTHEMYHQTSMHPFPPYDAPSYPEYEQTFNNLNDKKYKNQHYSYRGNAKFSENSKNIIQECEEFGDHLKRNDLNQILSNKPLAEDGLQDKEEKEGDMDAWSDSPSPHSNSKFQYLSNTTTSKDIVDHTKQPYTSSSVNKKVSGLDTNIQDGQQQKSFKINTTNKYQTDPSPWQDSEKSSTNTNREYQKDPFEHDYDEHKPISNKDDKIEKPNTFHSKKSDDKIPENYKLSKKSYNTVYAPQPSRFDHNTKSKDLITSKRHNYSSAKPTDEANRELHKKPEAKYNLSSTNQPIKKADVDSSKNVQDLASSKFKWVFEGGKITKLSILNDDMKVNMTKSQKVLGTHIPKMLPATSDDSSSLLVGSKSQNNRIDNAVSEEKKESSLAKFSRELKEEREAAEASKLKKIRDIKKHEVIKDNHLNDSNFGPRKGVQFKPYPGNKLNPLKNDDHDIKSTLISKKNDKAMPITLRTDLKNSYHNLNKYGLSDNTLGKVLPKTGYKNYSYPKQESFKGCENLPNHSISKWSNTGRSESQQPSELEGGGKICSPNFESEPMPIDNSSTTAKAIGHKQDRPTRFTAFPRDPKKTNPDSSLRTKNSPVNTNISCALRALQQPTVSKISSPRSSIRSPSGWGGDEHDEWETASESSERATELPAASRHNHTTTRPNFSEPLPPQLRPRHEDIRGDERDRRAAPPSKSFSNGRVNGSGGGYLHSQQHPPRQSPNDPDSHLPLHTSERRGDSKVRTTKDSVNRFTPKFDDGQPGNRQNDKKQFPASFNKKLNSNFQNTDGGKAQKLSTNQYASKLVKNVASYGKDSYATKDKYELSDKSQQAPIKPSPVVSGLNSKTDTVNVDMWPNNAKSRNSQHDPNSNIKQKLQKDSNFPTNFNVYKPFSKSAIDSPSQRLNKQIQYQRDANSAGVQSFSSNAFATSGMTSLPTITMGLCIKNLKTLNCHGTSLPPSHMQDKAEMTPISPSAADLNLRIASVKKVWDDSVNTTDNDSKLKLSLYHHEMAKFKVEPMDILIQHQNEYRYIDSNCYISSSYDMNIGSCSISSSMSPSFTEFYNVKCDRDLVFSKEDKFCLKNDSDDKNSLGSNVAASNANSNVCKVKPHKQQNLHFSSGNSIDNAEQLPSSIFSSVEDTISQNAFNNIFNQFTMPLPLPNSLYPQAHPTIPNNLTTNLLRNNSMATVMGIYENFLNSSSNLNMGGAPHLNGNASSIENTLNLNNQQQFNQMIMQNYVNPTVPTLSTNQQMTQPSMANNIFSYRPSLPSNLGPPQQYNPLYSPNQPLASALAKQLPGNNPPPRLPIMPPNTSHMLIQLEPFTNMMDMAAMAHQLQQNGGSVSITQNIMPRQPFPNPTPPPNHAVTVASNTLNLMNYFGAFPPTPVSNPPNAPPVMPNIILSQNPNNYVAALINHQPLSQPSLAMPPTPNHNVQASFINHTANPNPSQPFPSNPLYK